MGLFLPGHDLTAADLNDINLFPVAKTADYTASPGEMVLISGGKTITAPANVSGHIWGGKATDANTSNGFSSSTGSFKGPGVDGTTCPIGTTGAFCVWLGDGTNWHLIAGKADSGSLVGSAGVTGGSGWTITSVWVRKIGDEVTCNGQAIGGAAGASVAFTLPSGWAPPVTSRFALLDTSAGTGVRVDVSTGGDVTVVLPTAGDDVQLAGLRFQI